jgi:O-antigen/teichoic acid export membrane protein
VRRAALVTGAGYLSYSLVVALLPAWVMRLVYAGRYVEDAPLVSAFAVLNVVFLPVHILILEVVARRQQHAQFWAELWAVVATYSLGVYLISRFGVLGAGLTLGACGLGQLVYFASLVLRLRRADAHTTPGT